MIKRGYGSNEAGWKLVCLRLHFEHFEKLAISQTFLSSKVSFFIESILLYNFLEWLSGMSLFKKRKSRKKVVNAYYSQGLKHDLSIVFQAQASLGVS